VQLPPTWIIPCLNKKLVPSTQSLNVANSCEWIWQDLGRHLKWCCLTLLEPPSFGNFCKKNSSFRLPYQRSSSSADCTRELFNGSNELASLVDCTRKKNFCLGVLVFCEWRHKWSSFRVILAHVAWPKAQPLGQSVSLKFSLETRLESESFEPLIDFLAFLVQKLWSKINK